MTLTWMKDLQELFVGCYAQFRPGIVDASNQVVDLYGTNTCSITGSPSIVSNQFNANVGRRFNSASNYLTTSFTPAWSNITIITWVKVTIGGGRQYGRYDETWGMCMSPDGYFLLRYASGNHAELNPTIRAPADNNPHMVVFTWGDTGVRVIIDGVIRASDSHTGYPPIGNPMLIGAYLDNRYPPPLTDSGDFELYEIIFFNRQLSIDEIRTIYNISSKIYPMHPIIPSVRGVVL